jgi:regulator of protease activity HflC (stomatin/prohibitin superfamily)
MTFKPPAGPSEWQNAYTRDDAYQDSDQRSFMVGLFTLLPSVVILAIWGLITWLEQAKWWIILGGAILILLLNTALNWAAMRFSGDFFEKFYRPPSYVPASKVLRHRLYGKSRLPGPLAMLSQFEYILARDGDLDKKDNWPAWISRNMGGPILLIVFDGWALYIERGNRFSRVVGPGAPFLDWYETVKYVVDLRPQVKEGEVSAWTKDGINITIKARVECRIGSPAPTDPSGQLVFPFDPEAVKKAVERTALRWPDPKQEPSEFTWVDAVWGQVTGIVPKHIGSRFLDDLFLADRARGQMLSPGTQEAISRDLQEATQKFGVHVLDFQIVKIDIPEEIARLREEYWKTEQDRIETLRQGDARATQIRIQEKAYAEAQRDLILAIADGLEKNRNKQYSEPLLLSLSGILSESLHDPLMRAYMAKETLETLEKIYAMLDKNVS